MSQLSILGSGRVALALATALVRGGHSIILGTRDPSATSVRWNGPAVTFTDVEHAIGEAEVIFNATPGDSSLERLRALEAPLSGKTLLDIANATKRDASGRPSGLLYSTDSLAERLQQALPETHVVKTLNTMLFPVIADPSTVSAAIAFMSGESDEAKSTTATLLRDMGWSDDRIVDLGGIVTARGPEAVMIMAPDVIRSRGLIPFAFSIAT